MQELSVNTDITPDKDGGSLHDAIADLVSRGRAAMDEFAGASQERLDEAVTALAWSLYQPETARSLAEMAVEVTELGNVESKIIKNQRKTFGALRDLLRVKSTGIIEELPERGMVKYAKPVGVVAAVTPSTNPSATPINKAMMALKGGNAVIVAPSPLAWPVTSATVDVMRAELAKIGAPEDLVQILPKPVTREATVALMEMADLVVVTGSQNNVRRAYSSGTPAIGVGAGNVPVIIDVSADLDDAAEKICASKIFDNATSCSSENSVVIPEEIYDDAIAALGRAGGYMASAEEGSRIVDLLWQNGKLNRNLIAKDASVLADAFGLAGEAKQAKFFMVEETGIGPDYPLSDEKLALV
ncbi:MAG: aldehyde dehydrogenase family protein, partial [Hyphomicrobiales bacterium]|nr:aldehyde dehydrogenase family protein [Hyphomicrobiales bacterium]